MDNSSYFFVLGLSMIGFYEIRLPDFITNRILHIRGSGILSVFSMGLVAGFVAAPCTGPILASALLFISTGGSPLLGGVYLFFYALGLSVIFIAAGSFSSVLNRLPKSGRWMVVIRSVFAIAIMAYSIYLIDSVYGFSLYINPLFSLLLIAAGIAAGGLTREADFQPLRVKILKLLSIMLIASGVIGITGITQTKSDRIEWIYDYEEGMEKASALQKPVIIDFYANWCAACKEIKKKTIPDERIQKEAERFVMIMIDVSNTDEKIIELENKYKVKGLPAIIFLDSSQNEIENLRISGFVNPDEFLKRMKQVK